MTSRGSNLLLRTAVVIVMALSIGAPTPGRISGCNTGSGGGVAPSDFCRSFQTRVCARDEATGRIDAAGYESCLGAIESMCPGFNFPAGCQPSQSTALTCYDALVAIDRLDVPVTLGMPTLPECQAVCGGSGGGVDPEGI